MNIFIRIIALLIFCLFPFAPVVQAQLETNEVFKGRVLEVVESGENTSYGSTSPYQLLRIQIVEGSSAGEEIVVDHGKTFSIDPNQLVSKGETVVLSQFVGPDQQPQFLIVDRYRLDTVLFFVVLFFIAIILLSRWQGVGSIIGMMISLGIIVQYIIPRILDGKDPLVTSIVGCIAIMLITMYLAHGLSKRTTIALVSTCLTLTFTGVLSVLFVHFTHLSGLGSESAYSLKLGPTANINMKGLLLGGILIGALGVLDDVTTSLSAAVFELAKANPAYTAKDLFRAGLEIGKEHVSSLVNTLVLAYVGASLPIFLILVINPSGDPLWSILNSELIAEEIIRTLAGSIGLVLAVPLTTFLAATFVTQTHIQKVQPNKNSDR